MATTEQPSGGVGGELQELIDRHEAVDWRRVPGVSPLEAATWTRRLDEAQGDLP